MLRDNLQLGIGDFRLSELAVVDVIPAHSYGLRQKREGQAFLLGSVDESVIVYHFLLS